MKCIQDEAASAGLEVAVHELTPGKPIVVMKWEGTRPELPSIMLNSHIDVVPVEVCTAAHFT